MIGHLFLIEFLFWQKWTIRSLVLLCHCWINIIKPLCLKPWGIVRECLGLSTLQGFGSTCSSLCCGIHWELSIHISFRKSGSLRNPVADKMQDWWAAISTNWHLQGKNPMHKERKYLLWLSEKFQLQHELEEVTRLLFTATPLQQLEFCKEEKQQKNPNNNNNKKPKKNPKKPDWSVQQCLLMRR